MRVLFVTWSEKSHFFSMVPLAWAMTTAGHEVRVASQPELADVITQSGLTAVPVGTDHRVYEITPDILPADFELFDFGENRPERLTWPWVRKGYDYSTRFAFSLFNDTMVDDLVAYCRSWQPDLIVWEPLTYAGGVAGQVTGIPHARLLWGPDILGRMRAHFHRLHAEQPAGERDDPLRTWLAGVVERFGCEFDETVVTGRWTIDQMPAALRLPLDLDVVPVRFVPYNGPSVVPGWLRHPPERPRVCLTVGTTMRDHAGREVPVADLVEALADLDVELVATLTAAQRETLRRTPEHTRIEEFVPMNALLPTCSAVIHHGGFGTTSAAMLHGVPQLIVPWLWDTQVKGELLQEAGAGLYLPEVTPEAARDNIVRLLEDPAFAAGARALRAEVLAEPTPNDVAAVLEKRAADAS